jgi:hypothetical protein
MDQGSKDKILRRIHPEIDMKFISEHPQKAEGIVNSLPLREQMEMALERRGKERMELILLSSRAKSLVHMLPDQELYFTIKEYGEEETLPLLALANISQLVYIFDIEFWKEHALSPGSVFRWLDLLKQADEEQLRTWLKKADPELLISVLQNAVKIYVVDPDNLGAEPWREKDLLTLDDQYYFEIIDDQYRPIIERSLVQLRDLEQDKFYAILDDARMQLSTEVQDLAYRVRQGRLEDHGFYDFDDAIEIYNYLSPQKQRELEIHPERPAPGDFTAARHALTLAHKMPLLLAKALGELSPAETEEFHHQFARLANKVMIADALDLTVLDNLRLSVEKVYGYIEIGLEHWSTGKLERAVELLKKQWLEHIFQAGFSQVLDLSFRAQKIKNAPWFKFLGEPYNLFGELDGKRMAALLLKRPKFYHEPRKSNEAVEFKSMSDVRLALESTERVETWSRLFIEVLEVDKEELKALAEAFPFELSFKVALAQSLVTGVVRGRPDFLPLKRDELGKFIRLSMHPPEPPRQIYQNLKDEFLDWLMRRTIAKGRIKEELVKELAFAAIVNMEQELGIIKDPDHIDPRYITSLVIAQEKGK